MPDQLGRTEECDRRCEGNGPYESDDLGKSARDDEQSQHELHASSKQRKFIGADPERLKNVEHRHLIEHRTCHVGRSEEHTSELQSRFDLVCRLLLEKKKE